MTSASLHGSQARTSPWQELQRKLALGIRMESPQQDALIPNPRSRAQILAASSWLRRAHSRLGIERPPL